MSKNSDKALRIISALCTFLSTALQNYDSTESILDKFILSLILSLLCALVDAAEFYSLQGSVISNGSLKARSDEYIDLDEVGGAAPPSMGLKIASRAVVQPINLSVSLFNTACDRYFLLSSLAAMIRDLAKIPAPLSGIETGGAFWGACGASVAVAFATRVAADSYAVNKKITRKIEGDPTALPIQAPLLRLLKGKKLSVFKWAGIIESSFMDDTLPIAMLPYIVLQLFKFAEKDPVLKAGISIGLGSTLIAAAGFASIWRSANFDGQAINLNVRESHYLSPLSLEDRIQSVSKCQYRSLQFLLTTGCLFNGLNMGASTILAMYNQLDHFFDQLPENLQLPIRIFVYFTLFSVLLGVMAKATDKSEKQEAMNGVVIREVDEDELQHITQIPNHI